MSDATGSGTHGAIIQMPYWQPAPLADAFITMAYDTGWVSADINWPEWMDADEAKGFFASPATISIATAEQLQLLLTAIIRSDRFCEGAIMQAFQDGMVLAAADRAERLLLGDV